MKYVVYGLTSVLTSSVAATAVLHYAVALGQTGGSDLVAVPAVDVSGMSVVVEIVLGPGVPVLAEPAADDLLEPEHREFVADLTDRTRSVLARRGDRH